MHTSDTRARRPPGRILPILLFLAASACGDDGPSGPSVLQIGGQWNLTEIITDTQLSISCNNQASVTITQSGSNFTGTAVQTGTCTDATGSHDNSGTFQLQGGSIVGSNVSWHDAGAPVCQYTGTTSGTPPNRMSGTVQCTGLAGGVNFDFRGTWELTR